MIKLPKTPKDILIILAIVVLGVVLINQSLGYIYKAQFLKKPCDLCAELNPHLRNCFKESSTYELDQVTGKFKSGSPELLAELNKREGENYTKFNWFLNTS